MKPYNNANYELEVYTNKKDQTIRGIIRELFLIIGVDAVDKITPRRRRADAEATLLYYYIVKQIKNSYNILHWE